MRKTATDPANEAQLKTIAVEEIDAHPKNPRLALREDVVEGIRAQLNGQMAPEHALRVRPKGKRFELVSGHQRIEAARRAGLKQVLCWVRELDDDAAYDALLLDNMQGELSRLEKGVHCFREVGPIDVVGRSGALKRYAKKHELREREATTLHRVGSLLCEFVDNCGQPQLSIELHTKKVSGEAVEAIATLPKSFWDSFARALLDNKWNVEATESAVDRAKAYLASPVVTDWPQYLPVEACALAVGTGARLATDFRRLAALAEKVRAELAGTSEELASEWVAWLRQHSGGDSWEIAKVQAERIELEERAAALVETSERAKVEFPGLVLADPPWRYDFAETDRRQVENQYPTATTEEIVAMAPETAADCVLLLWATAPKLEEALMVMQGWGFTYKTHAVWDKEKIGMGYWFRGQHELLLVGIKGSAAPPSEGERVGSVFREARAKHSAKPEGVYTWIERAFPELVKLEMFARKARDGWQSMGNEA